MVRQPRTFCMACSEPTMKSDGEKFEGVKDVVFFGSRVVTKKLE